MKWISLILTVLFLVSCSTAPVTKTEVGPSPVTAPAEKQETTKEALPAGERISLYWENTTEPHPERMPWSNALLAGFGDDFELFSSAKDVTEFCPKFHSLDKTGKLKALGEFWVAVAYFESGFNPKSESVDVGTKSDKGSWSVGLYQLSGNDNSSKELGGSYEKLKDPVFNIKVSLVQLKKQVSKRGLFFLPNHDSMRYWAVILKNNRYSQIQNVVARVKKHAPKCY